MREMIPNNVTKGNSKKTKSKFRGIKTVNKFNYLGETIKCSRQNTNERKSCKTVKIIKYSQKQL